jgi:hypothetical protein
MDNCKTTILALQGDTNEAKEHIHINNTIYSETDKNHHNVHQNDQIMFMFV